MVVSSHSHSSHPHSSHRNWAQAGLSSFAIASALPTAMDSRQMAELFDKVSLVEFIRAIFICFYKTLRVFIKLHPV